MNQSSNPILPGTPQKPKKSHTGRIVLLIVFSPVIAFLLFMAWTQMQYFIRSKVVQHNAVNYLQEKYGEEFVVENYRVRGAGLGTLGVECVDSYPKNDELLRFELCVNEGSNNYSRDDYIDEIWEREEYDRLAKMVDREFAGEPSLLKVVDIKNDISSPLYKSIKGKPPTFASIAQGGGYFYRVGMRFYATDLEPQTRESINLKALKFARAVKKVNIKNGRVTVLYMRKEQGEIVYTITMPIDQIDSIENALDVDKYSNEGA